MFAITVFNDAVWDQHGLNWLRAAKTAGLGGYVIDAGLSDDKARKAEELRFDVVPIRDLRPVSKFLAVAECAKKDKKGAALFTEPWYFPSSLPTVSDDVDCVCDKAAPDLLYDFVTPLANLHHRAKVAKQINERIVGSVGGLFSANYVLGNPTFWAVFVGFQDFLAGGNYVEEYRPYLDNCFLNFFACSFGFSFKAQSVSNKLERENAQYQPRADAQPVAGKSKSL